MPCILLSKDQADANRPFNGSSMSVRLYWQPSNDRARIVIATRDRTGREEICCRPLTDLRIIREGSVLRLCKLRRDFQFTPWAELNFYMYERKCIDNHPPKQLIMLTQ